MALSVLAQGTTQEPLSMRQEPALQSLNVQKKEYETIFLKENEFLFKEGDTPTDIYFLKTGSVMTGVHQKQARGRSTGLDYVNKLVGPGEFFGYKSPLTNSSYQFFAKAIKASEVLIYPKNAFEQLLSGPDSLLKMVLLQTIRDLETYEAMNRFHYLASVEERIAYQLILLGDKFGVQTPEGVRLNLKLTRNELAQLAGTINESLSRHLTSFKNEGIIEVHGKEILIRDRSALEKKSGNF